MRHAGLALALGASLACTGCGPAGGALLTLAALLLAAGCGSHAPRSLPDAGAVTLTDNQLCSDAGAIETCEVPTSCMNCFCAQAYRDCGDGACVPLGELCAPCAPDQTERQVCQPGLLEPCCSDGPGDFCAQQMVPFIVCNPDGSGCSAPGSCPREVPARGVNCPSGYVASEICNGGSNTIATCCSVDGTCGGLPPPVDCGDGRCALPGDICPSSDGGL